MHGDEHVIFDVMLDDNVWADTGPTSGNQAFIYHLKGFLGKVNSQHLNKYLWEKQGERKIMQKVNPLGHSSRLVRRFYFSH